MSDVINQRTKQVLDVVARRTTGEKLEDSTLKDNIISFTVNTEEKHSAKQQVLEGLKEKLNNVGVESTIECYHNKDGKDTFPVKNVLKIDSKQDGFNQAISKLSRPINDLTRAEGVLDNILSGKTREPYL